MYFAKEIQPFIDKHIECNDPKYEEKRRIGENAEEICQIIRDDDIDKFIPCYEKRNKWNFEYDDGLKYETNNHFFVHRNSVMTYAAFFGSVQIFKYLINKFDKIEPHYWIPAVHSKNAESVFILEENNVEFNNNSFKDCIEEAISCHHNDIVSYLQSNYPDLTSRYSNSIINAALSFYNFAYIKYELIDKSNFQYLFQFNNLSMIALLIKNGKMDINEKIFIEEPCIILFLFKFMKFSIIILIIQRHYILLLKKKILIWLIFYYLMKKLMLMLNAFSIANLSNKISIVYLWYLSFNIF